MARDSFATYRESEDKVMVSISHFIQVSQIRKLRTQQMNMFVCVDAVVTKRTQVFNRLDQLFLTCNACGATNGPYNEGTAGHSANFWPD